MNDPVNYPAVGGNTEEVDKLIAEKDQNHQ